jgi:hypothetical protein
MLRGWCMCAVDRWSVNFKSVYCVKCVQMVLLLLLLLLLL